jgi:hypothetical protein
MSALNKKQTLGTIPAEDARSPGSRSEVVIEGRRAGRSSRLELPSRAVATPRACDALSCYLTDREIFDSAKIATGQP